MNRSKIAAGNWKMNKDLNSTIEMLAKMKEKTLPSDVEVIFGVPFPFLHAAQSLVADSTIHIAAQNCHEKDNGAYTGEVSAPMLTSIGIQYVILGHSERREYQNESNALLKEKTDKALEHNMQPIFCCGESLDIRKSGGHLEYVANQLTESLFHLSGDVFASLIIAYEPIWAIGTGETASPEQAQEMHKYLRNHIVNQYGNEVASKVPILYGGSVKPANAKQLFGQPDVDGGLVGGASLDSDVFTEIIMSF